MERITSVNNPKIKAYTSLVSSAKNRRDSGLFVLEGLRLCSDVLRSGRTVKEVYFTSEIYESNKAEIDEIVAVSEQCFEISDNVAEKMSDTKSAQGIFAVVAFDEKSRDIDPSGKYVLLENIQDPANLGAISRTAEAFGIDGIVVSGGCDVCSPKALRASMGALLRIPVIETDNVTKTIESAKKAGMKTYASTPKSDAASLTEVDFGGGVIVVVGNEANGVTAGTMECCEKCITIKMTGRAESLNAAAAASVIMWEMVKPSYERR